MKSGVLAFALFLALPNLGVAQTTDPATKELIDKLLARIDSLEKRVVQLEQTNPSARAAAPLTPAAPAPAQAAVAAAHAHDQAPVAATAAEAAQPSYPLLKLSGFSDFNFSGTNLHGASGGFGAQTLLGA